MYGGSKYRTRTRGQRGNSFWLFFFPFRTPTRLCERSVYDGRLLSQSVLLLHVPNGKYLAAPSTKHSDFTPNRAARHEQKFPVNYYCTDRAVSSESLDCLISALVLSYTRPSHTRLLHGFLARKCTHTRARARTNTWLYARSRLMTKCCNNILCVAHTPLHVHSRYHRYSIGRLWSPPRVYV